MGSRAERLLAKAGLVEALCFAELVVALIAVGFRLNALHRTREESTLPRMIHPYDNKTQTKWNHGDFKVQLMLPNSDRPMGFCDGSAEDLAELRAISEAEGAEEFTVHKRVLKTGREIWTLGG